MLCADALSTLSSAVPATAASNIIFFMTVASWKIEIRAAGY
jgi:hypothetical protein